MTEYAETIVLEMHQRVATRITGWQTLVRHDHLGPYISIIGADKEDRRLALDDGEAGADLTRYFWGYENRHKSTFIESRLGYTANDEEVLSFLTDCLAAETK